MDLNLAVEKTTAILSQEIGSVCTFGWFDDNNHKAFHRAPCHAQIVQGSTATTFDPQFYYTSLASSLAKGDTVSQVALKNFGEWIIGDESPWKMLTEGRQRQLIVDKGKILGYVIEVRPEDSLELRAHMSIAGRAPEEYTESFHLFNDLLELGMGKTDAFVAASFFSKMGKKVVNHGGYQASGHSAIYPVRYDGWNFSFKRFLEGKPDPYHKGTPFRYGKPTGEYGYGLRGYNVLFQRDTYQIDSLSKKIISDNVIRGRWSVTQLGGGIPDIKKVWDDGYRDELLKKTEFNDNSAYSTELAPPLRVPEVVKPRAPRVKKVAA